ncbi:universal stress protein [Mucilaginibacter limnophilus]|uniref:Universal stress protein n=1 Tax=Mucilaginibacter limnophilus TaxID=1932778 RepID=A0A3S2Y4M2_9SPHI|nr:universal stress protein [Mucilaginibacter limnophilus]RVU01935.1 universal stress protein [Mucilaginibacter limnophilus]
MQISKIIIGIDDSKYAEHAARYGFNLARKFDAAVGLVHIIEPVVTSLDTSDSILGMPMANVASGPEEMELVNAQEDNSTRLMNRVISEMAGDLQVSNFSEYGSTSEGILQCSIEFKADLIVLGTHKRSGLERLFSGSVAEAIIRKADIPVLVVPFEESH